MKTLLKIKLYLLLSLVFFSCNDKKEKEVSEIIKGKDTIAIHNYFQIINFTKTSIPNIIIEEDSTSGGQMREHSLPTLTDRNRIDNSVKLKNKIKSIKLNGRVLIDATRWQWGLPLESSIPNDKIKLALCIAYTNDDGKGEKYYATLIIQEDSKME